MATTHEVHLMEENAFWLRMWQTILVALVLLIATIVTGCNYNQQQYLAAGYCQISMVGVQGTVWTKCEK